MYFLEVCFNVSKDGNVSTHVKKCKCNSNQMTADINNGTNLYLLKAQTKSCECLFWDLI